MIDNLADRIKIERHLVPNGAIAYCNVVLLDGKLVASRLTAITPEEALEMARQSLKPVAPDVRKLGQFAMPRPGRPAKSAKGPPPAADDYETGGDS